MSKKLIEKQNHPVSPSILKFINESNKILALENLVKKTKQAKSLSLKIKKFLQNERPSLPEIQNLRKVYYNLQSIISTQPMPHLFTRKNGDFCSYEVIGELFFLAEKIYFGNKDEFLRKYQLLDKELRDEITPFLQYTQSNLEIIRSPSNLLEFTKHSLRIAQSIVGYIHVVTDSWVINPIPTKKEIDLLFSEIRNLKEM